MQLYRRNSCQSQMKMSRIFLFLSLTIFMMEDVFLDGKDIFYYLVFDFFFVLFHSQIPFK